MFKRNMFYTTAGRDGRKKISTLGRGVKGVLNNDKKLNNCKEGHSLLTKSQNFVICILKESRKHKSTITSTPLNKMSICTALLGPICR